MHTWTLAYNVSVGAIFELGYTQLEIVAYT